ncbi:MAG TPA: right-handed parallel beta-helix repeat-containing protein [Tepidisphaeraceae bacterium]|jgi:hypothetical protein|nr:right-handed parallel beta-helix repeat-containing protein [Tepidisphaeraceae bacterium]
MSITATTIWEIRADGNNANGGGFDITLGGTDYSQQAAAVASGTVTSAASTVTATTAIFTPAMVGNLITDGTTWKQITAYTSSTIVTVDSAPSWTAASIKVGGALASITALPSTLIDGWLIYLRGAAGTINVASNIVFAGGGAGLSPARFIGYTSTRGDNGRPTLQASSTCTTVLSLGASCWAYTIENLIIDCNNVANIGITYAMTYPAEVAYCKVINFKQYGINLNVPSGPLATCRQCEVTAGESGATAGITGGTSAVMVDRCWVHDNPCVGIVANLNWIIQRCRITNNTGASSDGIQTSYGSAVLDCTIHGNGRDGINYTQVYAIGVNYRGNIITSNGRYGMNFSTATLFPGGPYRTWDNNAYYNNTSGARSTSTGASSGLDITLTGLPYNNAAANDFSLNSQSGQGAACRAARIPGALPGTGTDYLDMGAMQSQALAISVTSIQSMVFEPMSVAGY